MNPHRSMKSPWKAGPKSNREERTIHDRTKQMSLYTALILFLTISRLLLPQDLARAAPPGNSSDWVMTFNDEFDGTSLDLSKWATTYPGGGRTNNDELEWYVDNAQVVSNGTLKLVAKHESAHSGFPYTSGMISSHNSFSQMYGYFEIRMKIPAGKGFWPAYWLLPTPFTWPPEIDVMENLGNDTRTIYMTHHYTTNYPNIGGGKGGQHGGSYTGPDYSADFHTYGVEWSSTAVVWYLDGVERYRSTEHVPLAGHGFTGMFVIANLAVGGSWPGAPDSSTIFPNQLEIDYIRIYSKGSSTDTIHPAAPNRLRLR
jgi:beta-glucanase (GH16 family)